MLISHLFTYESISKNSGAMLLKISMVKLDDPNRAIVTLYNSMKHFIAINLEANLGTPVINNDYHTI